MIGNQLEKIKIISELLKHGNITRACDRADISRQSFYDWLKKDTQFRKQVNRARKEALS